ncbi:putative RNA-directed DNA polymerase from transposon BS [Nymphon striatum]|nr:putative RNA-directed DNA polymerase from transposon BS [Nymphon striatum]
MDLMKFLPSFKVGFMVKCAKFFKRFLKLNKWNDKRSLEVLLTLLSDHLADLVESWDDTVQSSMDNVFDKLCNELDDSSDVLTVVLYSTSEEDSSFLLARSTNISLTKIENITLVEDQVDSYLAAVKQASGEQATDAIVASALLHQLSAEMRQSAIIHTDGSLVELTKHVKAYFKSRRSQLPIIGSVQRQRSSHSSTQPNDTTYELLQQCVSYANINYPRSLSAYYAKRTNLLEEHPEIQDYLEAGGFSVQIGSKNTFRKIPVDQTVEETIAKYELDAKNLTDSIESSWINPFSNDYDNLVSISTGRVTPKEVVQDLCSAKWKNTLCNIRNRSTIDHLVRFETLVREAFDRREHLAAVFFDLEKAYETTWKYGILRDLFNSGLRGRMPIFIKNFLHHRKFRVRVGTTFSDRFGLEMGVPQGSILSVTRFSLKINDIVNHVKSGTQCFLYVDDLVVAYASKSISTIERHLQLSLNKIEKWTNENGFKFSSSKTVSMHFCLLTRLHHDPQLRLGSSPIPLVNSTRFLGLVFDKKLNFLKHMQVLKLKCFKALNLLRILSNTNWGADRKVMLRFYRSLIRSKLDYGSVIYGSARKSYLRVLDPIHNQGLRLSLGAFRTTPAESLYVEAHEPSLYLRREKLSLQYACRLRANPENPCYDVTFHPNHRETFARRQNSIPTFGLRVLPLFEQIGLPLGNIARCVLPSIPPWTMNRPIVNFSLTGLKKGTTPSYVYLNKFLESKWDGEINNKLHAIKPKLGEWALAYRKSRKEESILCRLRVGHTYLTHSFLLRNEAQPVCGRCQLPLTVRHVLVDCAALTSVRSRFYSPPPWEEFFQEVDIYVAIGLDAVLQLLTCKCSRTCKNPACPCFENGLRCTDLCRLLTCTNQAVVAELSDNDCEDDSDMDDVWITSNHHSLHHGHLKRAGASFEQDSRCILRSTETLFNYKYDCLFCGCSDPYEGRRLEFKLIPVRSMDFRQKILKFTNEWVETVRPRILFAHDLPAADSVYHQLCNVNFRTGKQLPHQFMPIDNPSAPKCERVRGRTKDLIREEAFIQVAEKLK